MNHIVLFGAGKSATVLIDYLKKITLQNRWNATVADGNLEAVQLKVGEHELVKAVQLDIEDEVSRKNLVQKADIVLSLMPPALHYLLALDCIEFSKHLLTASYIDEKIKLLEPEIKERNLLFLCEMGLDPGIDHMSAMQLIHRIKALDGTITSFKSHCGGLVAPESDTNPWHYKISWNPRNIILAGKSGATFKENNEVKVVPYEELFDVTNLVEVPDSEPLSYYPNRDSLGYIPLYNLEEAKTFVRTTLRHPDFCFGWKNIIDLRLTSEEPEYNTNGLTIADFFKLHFDKHGFADWLNEILTTRLTYAKDLMENLMHLIETEEEQKDDDDTLMIVNEKGELNTHELEDLKDVAATEVAAKMHEANLSLKQLFFLGLDSNEEINLGICSAADVLQFIMEKKLALEKDDKDMVVMIHEIEYEADDMRTAIKSSLVVKGEDNIHTAMAKTVGLPLGIAAKLILQGKIKETGLHIPIISSIYNPVLKELEEHGIKFSESIS
ncbi:MAG TPA: saccharopine dehydrogenase C-terminal domain-containing protein [Segetibacter sp.]|jgi:saccharopine dehydrogenase-like NADP-dependent oxidoreductase